MSSPPTPSVGAGYATGSRARVDLGLMVVLPRVIDPGDLSKLAVFARKWGVEPADAR